jgi:hypothetical protein
MGLYFVPAWVYRFTLKSTVWFWWPLAFLGFDLKWANDPAEFRRTTIDGLWARTRIAIAALTIIAFLFSKLIMSGALFEPNPFLTKLGYLLNINWNLTSWQFLALLAAVLTIAIMYLVDEVVAQHRRALRNNNRHELSSAARKLGLIERLVRMRFLAVILLWLLLGTQAGLYWNSRDCHFRFPTNVQSWIVWIYGANTPEPLCEKTISMG